MSNKTQQTAVEWLVEQLEKHYVFQDIKNTTAFLQAKEMEKSKAFEIFKAGQDSMEEGGKGFENYYEQTYGFNK